MPHDATTDRATMARRNLLESAYGRFDLIPGLIPVRQLLQSKPRQAAWLIAERLGVSTEQIGIRALSSWLIRFKARHARMQSASGVVHEKRADEKGKEVRKPWEDFQPSEPKRQEPGDAVLLDFPRYD